MNRSELRHTVHAFIADYLGGPRSFTDDVSLQALGLDKNDIEELIFRLEDRFELTAFSHEEDQMLERARTVGDLIEFLQVIDRE
ncbi:acyl carrier protein [Pseudomonas sp. R5(2019)]|uniref:acyl carrier protein n=1 Tax=Pseudomonas sp. R5(2019) TaxID=2697566 RepID=UPI001412A222|nr:acyl carrier protein [Pseudomonas sp. R5(2019)]NBA97806.1 acyl carrier protein [Pseudomonas sp. R5(2019)]